MSDERAGGDSEFRKFDHWRPPVRRSNFIRRFWRSIQWRNWPIGILFFLCIAVFIAQVLVPLPLERWGLSAAALRQGHYETLITSIFMHGGGWHLLANMTAYLAVAPLVCARFGGGVAGRVSYHVFFLLCGLAGALFSLALRPSGDVPLVGASGAIYGLFAAAFRLDPGSDGLRPHLSKHVLSGWRWMVISNLVLIAMFGGLEFLFEATPGSFDPLTVPVAWEAHVGGFVAGIFLMDRMARKGWQDDWRGGFADADPPELTSSS